MIAYTLECVEKDTPIEMELATIRAAKQEIYLVYCD